ncbi:MAG: hypothetical protein J2P17_12195 [Mycobacterium sp.]|nr:hypothetical protein [Mycobacterium sp.]
MGITLAAPATMRATKWSEEERRYWVQPATMRATKWSEEERRYWVH